MPVDEPSDHCLEPWRWRWITIYWASRDGSSGDSENLESIINQFTFGLGASLHGSWRRYRHPKLDDLCERWGLPYTD